MSIESEGESDFEIHENHAQMLNPNISLAKGFKNLICPLCLNVIYKCTTTICGHSFCERCLDEYIILRKVSKIHLKTYVYRLASFAMM